LSLTVDVIWERRPLRNLVWIVLDSARWDVVEAAHRYTLDKIGPLEKRWSYATWTAPSHLTFLMGLLPHAGKPGAFPTVEYRAELCRWAERLEARREVRFSDFSPALSLPLFLRRLGYRCEARVSLPVLNPATVLSSHFDHYELLPAHNNLAHALGALSFDEQPVFHFINTGETHYPYSLAHETAIDLPRIPGVHGVWRSLDQFLLWPGGQGLPGAEEFPLDARLLRPLWEKQLHCVEHLDGVIGEAVSRMPKKTWVIVTSDHGELFGEDGWFGHGPVCHEKVFEVFLIEGLNPFGEGR
jgi:hypothetical protein